MIRIPAHAILIASLLGLVLANHPGRLFAQDSSSRELIAVLGLQPVQASEAEALALTDRLREVLLKTGKFTLVDRSQMSSILQEQALQQTGCTEQECAVQVGRILGVRKLVAGKVVRVSDRIWMLSALLVDVETAETLQAESLRHRGDYFTLLDERVPELGRKLSDGAPAMTRAVAPQKLPPPVQVDPKPKSVGVIEFAAIPEDARVTLDGIDKGSGVQVLSGVPAGAHELKVVRKGYRPWVQRIVVQDKERVQVKTDPQPSRIAIFANRWHGRFYRDGFHNNWVLNLMRGAIEKRAYLKLTHCFPVELYVCETSLFTHDDVRDDTWEGIFVSTPNEEFIYGKAAALDVDLVMVVDFGHDGSQGKSIKVYVIDVARKRVFVNSGDWGEGTEDYAVSDRKITERIERALDEQLNTL